MNGKPIRRLLKTGLLVIPVLISHVAAGQKQLVILKRGEVVARYNPGDDFVFTRKGSPAVIDTYVNNLSDTAVVTHRDTIPFHRIDRIYFRQHNFLQTLGASFVIAGAGYFLVDQVNHVIVDGNDPELDSRVNGFAVPAVALGVPLMFVRKKSQRMGYRYRLLMVTKESPFYYNDRPTGYVSPYIPR